jgi:hypothetical protein
MWVFVTLFVYLKVNFNTQIATIIPTLVHVHMGQGSTLALIHVVHTPSLTDPPH